MRQWRGLAETELSDLSPHLNLISGANESGKSRLVQALRFALFESSQGLAAHKKALAGWLPDPGRPQVEVDFHLDGDWQLVKSFLGRGHDTTLRGPGGTLEGAPAEERLAEMLQVSAGGPRESRWQDLGIWPLLWVEQGGSRERPEQAAGEGARTALEDVLSREIGEVAAGPVGQRLLELAREQSERYFTPRTGKPTGPLAEASRVLEAASGAHASARAERDAIEQDAAALERAMTQQADLAQRLASATQQHAAALAAVQRAQAVRRQLELAGADARAAAAQQARLVEQRSRIEEERQALASLEAERRTAEDAIAVLRDRVAQARATTGRSRLEADSASATYIEARTDLERVQQRARLAAARPERDRLTRQLETASRTRARLAADREALAALPAISAQILAALHAAARSANEARARLAGAAVVVEIEAKRAMVVDGDALQDGERRTLQIAEERDIHIPGMLAMRVRPGGGELPRLRDAAVDAQDAFVAALEAAGVSDLAAAESARSRRAELEAAVNATRRELDAILPEGEEAANAALAELSTALAELGDDDDADDEAVERARGRAVEAERARDVARERRDRDASAIALLERDLQEQIARQEDRVRRTGLLGQRLAPIDLEALKAEAARAAAEAEGTQAALAAARAAVEASGGEDVDLALDRAEQAKANLARELAEVNQERIRLASRIEHAGEVGAHEKVLAAAQAEAGARDALATLERQAAAASRLYEVLEAASQAARERLTRPVVERIAPYLAQVFPGTRPWLDDGLALKGLRGERIDEHFEMLSGGAREQLALLVRLGLAEVLSQRSPWPLVLDDVLVNSDPHRVERMHAPLYRASRHFQVLLFTCHARHFDALGADRLITLPAGAR